MKTVTIEELLSWAFVQELWKVGVGGGASAATGSSWSMVSDFGELGTLIDRTLNAYGVIPGYEEGDPHPDALAVGVAVNALPAFEIPAGLDWFADWPMDEHGNVAAAVAAELALWDSLKEAGQRQYIISRVISCSVLGRAPDWRAEYPGETMVMKHGKPAWFIQHRSYNRFRQPVIIEANGYDKKSCRPMVGAYRKWVLREPIGGYIRSRIDWYLWQSALAHLSTSLPRLVNGHLIRMFIPEVRIWEGHSCTGLHIQPIERMA